MKFARHCGEIPRKNIEMNLSTLVQAWTKYIVFFTDQIHHSWCYHFGTKQRRKWRILEVSTKQSVHISSLKLIVSNSTKPLPHVLPQHQTLDPTARRWVVHHGTCQEHRRLGLHRNCPTAIPNPRWSLIGQPRLRWQLDGLYPARFFPRQPGGALCGVVLAADQ